MVHITREGPAAVATPQPDRHGRHLSSRLGAPARAGRFHTMRGSAIKPVIVGVLAIAVLAACTAKSSTTTPSAVPAALTSSVAPASPVVTVPPVTEPLQSSAPVSPITSDPSSSLAPTTTTVKPIPPKVIPAATYSSSPRLGSTDLLPRTSIVIRSANGTLSGVALTNPGGSAVKGTLS